VKQALGIGRLSGWTKSERLQFERWCPLLYSFRDLAEWSQKEKRGILTIIKSKASL